MNRLNKILSLKFNNSSKTAFQKIRSSFIAILIGLTIGIFVILIKGGNPFMTYYDMFIGTIFEQNTMFINYMYYFSMFILLGVGIGVSFKTGLFNIGASGQFLFAGLVTMMIGSKTNFSGGPLILIIIAIISGAFLASIAGLLKAFFNVHEVVSTIMLNWIITYIVKYLISVPGRFFGGLNGSSVAMNSNMIFSIREGSTHYILVFLIALSVAAIIYLMFKYTTFGFKLRVNGESGTVAEYSGINQKMTTILSMAISGAIAGLAGYIFYGGINKGVMPGITAPPAQGFEAITVTLLASSSPIGAIPAAMFYAAMSNGQHLSGILAGGGGVLEFVVGIVIFVSALSSTFINISPFNILRKFIWLFCTKEFWNNRVNHYKNLIQKYKEYKTEVKPLKKEWVETKKNIYLELTNKIKYATNDILMTSKNEYDENKENELRLLKLKIEDEILDKDLIAHKNKRNDFIIRIKEIRREYLFNMNTTYKKKIEKNIGVQDE